MRRLGERIAGLAGWCRLCLGTGAGATLALAQAPVSFPFVLFIALPVLLWLLDGAPGAAAGFRLGWAAGAGFFAAALFWIVEPFLIDPVRHGWMAPFALMGMAGGLALFWGAGFALARTLWRPGPWRAAVLAAAWAGAEFVRSHVFTGFPWALPSYAWSETPVIQSVALFGPHGLAFLTLLAGLLPGVALRGRRAGGAVLAALLVALAWGGGEWRLAQKLPVRADPVVVRLVQANAEQRLKWLPEMQQVYWDRHLALSQAPADPPPDVTIWPETAVPFLLGSSGGLQAEAAASAGPEGVLVLGIRRVETGPEDIWFNSLAVLGPGGRVLALYDKYRLVPFGEYIPFARQIAGLGLPVLQTLTASGFAAGPGGLVLRAAGLPPFLPLICYEAIFPQATAATVGRPEWLVQITNDSWFGELAGPYQHFAQARIRAIEQGLPLARAANTGISAMIGPRGEVLARLDLGDQGVIDAPLPAALAPTFYATTGDLLFVFNIITIFLLTFANHFSGNPERRGR